MASIKQQMIINDAPGEECRIAILENGRLEELYSERESQELHVNNIYLGRVMNVEAAIQAAFIDFGIGRNGFLHISDLHPMFFPGASKDTTEPVGKKTPHRNRPPIQQCLKRGQEIMVQVIKEGIGTKGPTLTSYLSIPGRYLVMMPNMENLGVSRKLEDLDVRREMRRILDSVELPKGYGFILRTAGLGRPKTDLKRDLAFLQRLWKTIDSKRAKAQVPAELYAESDLLIRTIRDVLTSDVEKIIVDTPEAEKRISEFLKIISPRRRGSNVILHDDRVPIFHRYHVEQQIRDIHAREVPLPSGGSIVIDSAEALVAIDVNSGKSRRFKDAGTTAYRTNLEAIDEICRQLRLRDLGGLVVLDLIDMISSNHRRDVENRLRDLLKNDRAKTEFLRISRFGMIEMTRQRMRPSIRGAHFMHCPSCDGRAYIKTPESTAVDAVRELSYLLQHPKVAAVEMVVSHSVASTLLSTKRRYIGSIEDQTGKAVTIRVSQAIAVDRVDFYAYDDRQADIDTEQLTLPAVIPLDAAAKIVPVIDIDAPSDGDAAEATEGPAKKKRRRRGRRGRGSRSESATPETESQADSEAPHEAESESETNSESDSDAPVEKKRRRRSRRRKSTQATTETTTEEAPPETTPTEESVATDDESPKKKKRTRRGGRRRKGVRKESGDEVPQDDAVKSTEPAEPAADSNAEPKQPAKKKTRSRRKSSSKAKKDTPTVETTAAVESKVNTPEPKTKPAAKRRTLYGSRRKLSPAAARDVAATSRDE